MAAGRSGVFKRLAQAFMASALGCYLGYQYAVATIPAATLERTHVAGMYARAGAVVAVLGLRMGMLFWAMGREFFTR